MAHSNQAVGAAFEEIFIKQARLNGLLPMKNHLTAKFVGAGRTQLLKSELDFTLISQDGRVAFIDCKSFQGDHFKYSQLDSKQIERAVMYNSWQVPSGFVTYFRATREVCYYSGQTILDTGSRARFESVHSLSLGLLEKFDLRKILNAPISKNL